MRKSLLLLPLLLACIGCSARTQVRTDTGRPLTRIQAYEATYKAFEDCGLDPRGNRTDMVIESHWDWLGIGPASQFLLFPLSWARYQADIRDDRVDLRADAHGFNWLSVWMNLPFGFPIGRVKERIQARLEENR